MQPKLSALKADETTAFGLRLMRGFLKLRDRRHLEEVITLVERLLEVERKYPAVPGD
jgi:hypothetical protein